MQKHVRSKCLRLIVFLNKYAVCLCVSHTASNSWSRLKKIQMFCPQLWHQLNLCSTLLLLFCPQPPPPPTLLVLVTNPRGTLRCELCTLCTAALFIVVFAVGSDRGCLCVTGDNPILGFPRHQPHTHSSSLHSLSSNLSYSPPLALVPKSRHLCAFYPALSLYNFPFLCFVNNNKNLSVGFFPPFSVPIQLPSSRPVSLLTPPSSSSPPSHSFLSSFPLLPLLLPQLACQHPILSSPPPSSTAYKLIPSLPPTAPVQPHHPQSPALS